VNVVRLTDEEIDSATLIAAVTRPGCGAVVLFLGTVRDVTGDDVTVALDYEAYPEMAEKVLAQIEREARDRWPLGELAVVHRLGRLAVSDVSVAVALSCPHRADAFAAAQFVIDRAKQIAPIWKRDIRPGGAAEWVHPS
jgi:molybdopterin synthase catalytic subunit